MPRVVPSQIVELINKFFPQVENERVMAQVCQALVGVIGCHFRRV
jgi:hypothetical protein